MSSAEDTQNSTMAEAKESEDSDVQNKVINENIINIYSLLQRVVSGAETIKVTTGTERLQGM